MNNNRLRTRWLHFMIATCAAWGFSATTQTHAATPADALVMAWNIDAISTFDPGQIGEVAASEILYNTCSTLVSLAPDDETHITPSLAQSWEVSDDGLKIIFHLREDLKFIDGEPANAHHLAWSLQRVVKLGFGTAAVLTEYGYNKDTVDEMITAPDEKTLIMRLDKPYPPRLILAAIGANYVSILLNQKVLMEHEIDGDMGNKYLATHIDCVGPYQLVRWNPSEIVQLRANSHYWGEAPKLPNVLIRHVSEPGTQRLLLERGDVDVARDLLPEDLRDMETKGEITVARALRPQLVFLNMNNSHPAFSNPKVRLAMRYLIDYQALGETVIKGIGIPRNSFVQLGAFGALDEQQGQMFQLDIDKAKALLAEAGYAQGFEANMLIGTLSYTAPIAQSIQDNAAKAGIKLNIERMANNQLFSRVRAREFDTSMMAWATSVADAHGMASRHVYNPDNRPEAKLTMFPSWRVAYQDEAANAQVMEALFERDEARRILLYHALQRQMMEEGPVAYIFQTYHVAGLNKGLKNWVWNGFRSYYEKAEK